jgi:hypothetical protein
VHEVLSEASLVLGGYANPSGISAADFYAALFLADDAFHDGLLPTYEFVDGDVFTPSSYLIAPDITPPAVPEPSTWIMALLGGAWPSPAGARRERSRVSPSDRVEAVNDAAGRKACRRPTCILGSILA